MAARRLMEIAALLGWMAASGAGAEDTNLMERISARLRETRVVRAEFEQSKTLAALDQPLRSSGEFIYARDHGLFWHTREPIDSVLIATPDKIIQMDASAGTADASRREQPGVRGFIDALLSVFTGEPDQMNRFFEVDLAGEPARWAMALVPRHPKMRKYIDRIEVSGSGDVERMAFVEKSGDATETLFRDIRTEPPFLTDQEKSLFDE